MSTCWRFQKYRHVKLTPGYISYAMTQLLKRHTMEQRILRFHDVKIKSGFARSTIYKYIAKGLWTKPVRLTSRAVGWPAYEIDSLIAARISGKSEETIRLLVKELETARKTAC